MTTTMMHAYTARQLMTSNPVSIHEHATLREAAAFLTRRSISGAPVINDAGRPVGVLSRTDIIRFSGGVPVVPQTLGEFIDEAKCLANSPHANSVVVGQIMTPHVLSVDLDASLAQVCEQMIDNQVHRVFVTDEAGILVGVISALDALRCLTPSADHFG